MATNIIKHKNDAKMRVRLNHAVADGYLVAKIFLLLDNKMTQFARRDDRWIILLK